MSIRGIGEPATPAETAIWITWELQRRNRSMAARLGARLFEMQCRGGRFSRYWRLGWRTLVVMRKQQPKVVYFQNPSLVLSVLVTIAKCLRLTSARTVGDFHNAGVFPPVAGFLVPWMVRANDLVIVSNDSLREQVEAMGGRAVAIPDPVPEFHVTQRQIVDPGFRVLFICSWADDEPIAEVLSAAAIVQAQLPDVRIAITGRTKLERIGWNGSLPGNVDLTGFLSEQEFDARLASCDAVLDLTTRADCMVCGAYEATGAGVPMIISDNPPSRAYFDRGALFTDNSHVDIARAIIEMHEHHARMRDEVRELRAVMRAREDAAFGRLHSILIPH